MTRIKKKNHSVTKKKQTKKSNEAKNLPKRKKLKSHKKNIQSERQHT